MSKFQMLRVCAQNSTNCSATPRDCMRDEAAVLCAEWPEDYTDFQCRPNADGEQGSGRGPKNPVHVVLGP
jgi:hypothetical protein